MLAGGTVLWLALAGGGGPKVKEVEPGSSKEHRESSRHRSGEVEKHRATPLEKKFARQEQLVEEKRKVLVALAKSRGPVFHLGADGAPPTADSPEEAEKKAQAVRDYEATKKEYLADRQLLQQLKQELAEEKAKAKADEASR